MCSRNLAFAGQHVSISESTGQLLAARVHQLVSTGVVGDQLVAVIHRFLVAACLDQLVFAAAKLYSDRPGPASYRKAYSDAACVRS